MKEEVPEKTKVVRDQREYYKKNKIKLNEYGKKYRAENKEKVKIGKDRWRKDNHEKERAMLKRRYEKIKKTTLFITSNRIKVSMARSLRGNKQGRKWESLVGYTCSELQAHLTSLFQKGMTWENKSDWHIDHIVPMSAFNYETPEDIDFKKCWSLKNLRPMWATENQKKYNKVTKSFQPSLLLGGNIGKTKEM